MKSMWPPSAAIFFMIYFHRAEGAWPPRPPPPGSATGRLLQRTVRILLACILLLSFFFTAMLESSVTIAVADPRFPRRSANSRDCTNLLFGKKKQEKKRKLDRGDGTRPYRHLPRSVTELSFPERFHLFCFV